MSMVETKLNINRCRVCLENVSKLYPLEGPIANVDVDVSTMIAYCTSIEIEISDDLPDGVCIPCFRTIRIAYNFINQFKESHKLLTEEKWTYTMNVKVYDKENELTEPNIYNNKETQKCNENKTQKQNVKLYKCNEDIIQEYNECELQQCNKKSGQVEEARCLEKCYVEENNQLRESEEYEQPKIEVIIEDFNDRVVTLFPEHLQLLSTVNDINEKSNSVQLRFLSEESNAVHFELQEENCSQTVTPPKMLPKLTLRRKFLQQFSCPKCPGSSHTDQNFLHHISEHQGETFHCNMCSLEDKLNVDEFMYHFIELHRYQCPFCKKSFSRKGTQYAHMKTHNNVRYSCSFPDCNKSFVTPWSLRKHQNIHSDTVRYSCEKCNVSFKTYDTYRYHLKTHNGRNFLCPFCGKTYLQSVHLKYHLWQHSGLKQFKCILCSKSYTSITQLKKHSRKFHGSN